MTLFSTSQLTQIKPVDQTFTMGLVMFWVSHRYCGEILEKTVSQMGCFMLLHKQEQLTASVLLLLCLQKLCEAPA